MLTFLSPLFLAGAAAAVIPIVLHLLKREPEPRVKFSAVKLLRRAPVENTERRRLRDLLLLALRVAALLLLALAFARPFFASGAASASTGVTVVALDTSLSLSAPGQFERAKRLAREAIGRAGAGDLVGVVTFADDAQVAAAPSGDRALAALAVEGAAAGFGATRYRAALSAATEMVASHGGRGTIVIVTDLQESGWDAGDRASVPESVPIEVVDVGAPPPNLAVTALRPAGDRVVATVRNASPSAREARVELTVDGRTAGEATSSLGPNQSGELTLPGARGATAVVSVDDRDGVQADNARYAVLDNASRPLLLVVTATGDLGRGAFYVQQALTVAGADGAAYQVEGVGGAQLSGWNEARLDEHVAVLLLSTRGLERRGRELLARYARRGGGVLVAAGPDLDGGVVADVFDGRPALSLTVAPEERDAKTHTRTLAPADARHPVFQTFGTGAATLGLVKFQRIATIGDTGCQTLARFTTGEPALVDCAPGEGRALVIASDLNKGWNDFPLHATFVPFLHEAVRYLAGGRTSAAEYLVGDAPSGVPPRPGIATLAQTQTRGRAPRRVAVNVDPAESDPGRLSADQFQAAVTRLKEVTRSEGRVEARQQEDRQHLWQYVLVMMIAMLAVESLVATRTS
jgi:hypothetical protein